jgi:5-methylcytosine-specific restriction endonuclease McrA
MKEWKDLSRAMRQEHPVCQDCGNALTEDVHHINSPFEVGLNKYVAIQRLLDPNNLVCLCRECHNKRHGNVKNEKDPSSLEDILHPW